MREKNTARTSRSVLRASRTSPREAREAIDIENLAARPTWHPGYPDNTDRAAWAAHAVAAFGRRTDQLGPDAVASVELVEELAADLLCDLMHLIDKIGGNAEFAVARGIGHHAFEADEEAARRPAQASAE